MKKVIIVLVVLAVGGLGFYLIRSWQANKLYNNPDFASGNGRIEATEINVAAKLTGKVESVNVQEGDKVVADQVLVIMQTNVLEAKLAQAKAKLQQTATTEASSRATVAVREATLEAKKAEYEEALSVMNNAETKYKRSKQLVDKGAISRQIFDDDETAWIATKAQLASALAAVREAEADLNSSKALVLSAKANILAAAADISAIEADISDSILKAPLKGRIQYRIAEPGEVLSEGGRAINMVDLTDVYMTFFLPEEIAGKVDIGAEVRIVLDAGAKYPIPAKVTYVASVAQFTPKTVETRVERQKLMFRIKAHIDRDILETFIDSVKTGLPGVAWVKLNKDAPWPKELSISEEDAKFVAEAKAKAKARLEQEKNIPADVMTAKKEVETRLKSVDSVMEQHAADVQKLSEIPVGTPIEALKATWEQHRAGQQDVSAEKEAAKQAVKEAEPAAKEAEPAAKEAAPAAPAPAAKEAAPAAPAPAAPAAEAAKPAAKDAAK